MVTTNEGARRNNLRRTTLKGMILRERICYWRRRQTRKGTSTVTPSLPTTVFLFLIEKEEYDGEHSRTPKLLVDIRLMRVWTKRNNRRRTRNTRIKLTDKTSMEVVLRGDSVIRDLGWDHPGKVRNRCEYGFWNSEITFGEKEIGDLGKSRFGVSDEDTRERKS